MAFFSINDLRFGVKLSLSFGCLILAMCIGGILAINATSNLSQMTDRLYRHPYAVSTTLRDIETSLTAMHRGMKDVAMAESVEGLEAAANLVKSAGQQVEQQIDFLKKRFQGDQGKINKMEKLVIDWQPIRQKVISQRRTQLENDTYRYSRTISDPQVFKLGIALEEIVWAAEEKAEEYIEMVEQIEEEGRIIEKFFDHAFTVSATAAEMESGILNVAQDLKDLVVATTVKDVVEYGETIDFELEEIGESFGLLRENFLGDPAMIDKAENLFKEWGPIREQIIALRTAQVSVNPGEVTRLEGAPQLEKINTVLSEIKQLSDTEAATFIENAGKQATSSRNFLLVIFGLASALGLVAAAVVTKSITTSLDKAVDFARGIAGKDLTISLDINERKDEIGDLAQALNNMRAD